MEHGNVISPTFSRPVVAVALRVSTRMVWTVLFTGRIFQHFGLEKGMWHPNIHHRRSK